MVFHKMVRKISAKWQIFANRAASGKIGTGFCVQVGAQYAALPGGGAAVFVQKVHQQRGVQVQRLAGAAGQLDGKAQLLPCRFIVDAGQMLLEVQRFVAALGLFW